MEQPRFDRDRMLLYATLLCALVSIILYVTVYLTMIIYGPLNTDGLLLARVALFVAVGALGLALVLALTARNVSLSGASLSGAGWFLVFAGIAMLFPAWGMSISTASAPGVTGFGGFAGSVFLLLAGGLLVQAEHRVRERQE
jgi:hypothetical protein